MQPSILKPLSLCPPCGTTESATTHGAGETVIEYIRFRPGADKSVVNARIDAMIEKYHGKDKKKYGYTAFVKPIRDTYRNYESVERMRNIMTVLGLAILFIAALNYVLISISSLTYRAKAVDV